jgi:uncharacterized protein YidB (DUF937 family)
MDLSDIINMGAKAFQNNTDSSTDGLDLGDIAAALSGLLGSSQGGLDLGSLVAKMQQGGLGSVANSWLGDGGNDSISTGQLQDILGQDKITEFSSRLGVDRDNALGGLAQALPDIVDKSSSGGSLLDSLGGLSGAMDMAGKLFR